MRTWLRTRSTSKASSSRLERSTPAPTPRDGEDAVATEAVEPAGIVTGLDGGVLDDFDGRELGELANAVGDGRAGLRSRLAFLTSCTRHRLPRRDRTTRTS